MRGYVMMIVAAAESLRSMANAVSEAFNTGPDLMRQSTDVRPPLVAPMAFKVERLPKREREPECKLPNKRSAKRQNRAEQARVNVNANRHKRAY